MTASAARRWWSAAAATAAGLAALGLLGAPAHGSVAGSALRGTSFDPRSITFVSLDTGWALGTASCAPTGACLQLRETIDAGRSWFARPLPPALVADADREVGGVPAELSDAAGLDVRFADRMDGWIYGELAVAMRQSGVSSTSLEATLWSTHDGGVVWRAQPLHGLGSQGSIFDLEAAAGTAYLMESNATGGVSVKSSPVGANSWRLASSVPLRLPAGGAEPSGAFVLSGSDGWLVEGNDRGTTGSARLDGGRWVSWTPPCASVGHSFAIPAAATAHNLVAVCVMGGFAYPLSKSAPAGAKLGSSWLYSSNDAGKTFAAEHELRGPAHGFAGVIASPSPGVILLAHDDESGEQNLIASFDGGVHWTVVHQGQVFYIGFTSAKQGVALLASAGGATEMIMTFDGGHRWSPVTF